MLDPAFRNGPLALLEEDFDASDIEHLVGNTELESVENTVPIDPALWAMMNARFFAKRPDVRLRLYGFYGAQCDLAFLETMTNVRNLSVDAIYSADNVSAIGQMSALKQLRVEIYALDSFAFLDAVPVTLERLVLGATKSKKPKLQSLGRFSALKELYVEGHSKGIESIEALGHLETLTLRSVSLKSLDFLKSLPSLRGLEFKLGGTQGFQALTTMTELNYLELWQVRGLADLDFISSMTGLQALFLQSLPQVQALPDASRLAALTSVHLETMKGLQDISGLAAAPALEDLTLIAANHMEPEDWVPIFKLPTLKRVQAGFGSDKKNDRLDQLLTEYRLENVLQH